MQRIPIAVVLVLGLFCAALSGAEPVDSNRAEMVARAFIAKRSSEHSLAGRGAVRGGDGRIVLHVFALTPAGFVLATVDTVLPPVIGYSLRNQFLLEGPAFEHVASLFVADVELRLKQAAQLPHERLEERRRTWRWLVAGELEKRQVTYWPPDGTTTTGGWVETQWSQSSPYNDDCPVDPVTAIRSIAGCPAVAMAQILNYHRTTNGARLDDGDDYYHSYAGRNYWIDDDWEDGDFPSFPTLAGSLDTLDDHYRGGVPADAADAAALVFACGVAAEQVYTSSASGTFGVAQAVQAYGRFGFQRFELLDEGDADLYPRMEQNMKDGRPVHLAVVDPGWTMGHNVVIDGFCSDGDFHLNFGWGGSYDGW
ncbi:MAG: C10 family peptidase [Thermoanaerobaculales bacterium]|nr:C10 family peptidase [Thermoanaerobaculales bacterium]